MSDIFQDGSEGKCSAFMAALTGLQNKGQAVLDDIDQVRSDTLVRFEQGLSALNARRQRAYRMPSPDIAGRFIISDLLDVDQAASNVTLRADSQAVTLRERENPAQPVFRSTVFSSSQGTIEQFGDMYRVTTGGGAAPTGVFNLELETPTALTLVVFDIVMSPSDPIITVETSPSGVRYSSAVEVSRNGYRVNAWLPPGGVRFLRISITASLPDTLGGNAYTFGLTSMSAFMVQFHLQSEMATKEIVLQPRSRKLHFATNPVAGALYFLALGDSPFIGVTPGQGVAVPGAVEVNAGPTACLDDTGRLGWQDAAGNWEGTVPGDTYLNTLTITGEDGAVRIAPGLNPTAAVGLRVPCFCLYQGGLYYRPFTAEMQAKKFTVAYTTGPLTLPARFRVQLTTRDRAATPVFKGAWLENTV